MVSLELPVMSTRAGHRNIVPSEKKKIQNAKTQVPIEKTNPQGLNMQILSNVAKCLH